jgi:hypothetical protein
MVLLFFVLIPVVPLLAAQINYDNLIMVMTAGLLLLTVKFQENLSHQRFNSALLLIALSIGMLGCLTQYLFMPIFAAMIIYLVYIIYRYIRTQPDYKITTLIKKDFQSMKKSVLIGSLAFFIVSGSLFVEMYAVNLVLYKNPVPACNQVLSTKDCLNYYAFERNYEVEAVKVKINSNPVIYSAHWAYRLFEFTFYTVSGGSSPLASYPFAAPLPGISLSAIGLFCFGSLLLIKYLRSLLREYPHVGFMLYVAIFFIAALWYRNYSDFLQIGQRVGINGRYLIPVMLAIALAFKRLLKQRPLTKTILLVAVLLLFLQGGGALTFIDASSSYWYWPNNSSVNKFNRQTQKIIRPLIYHHNLYRIGKNLYD